MRRSLAIALAVVAVGWWFSPIGPSHHRARAAEAVGAVSCPMPPSVTAFGEPLQSDLLSNEPHARAQPETTPLVRSTFGVHEPIGQPFTSAALKLIQPIFEDQA